MKRFVHTSASGSVALMAMGLLAVLLGGCTTKARIPVTGIEVPVPNIPLPALLRTENDLRSRSWTKAFDILHARLTQEYAYTEHKGIDWNALYAQIAPEVAAAESAKDPDGWYVALRKYFHAIPDPNIQFDPNDFMRGEAEGASAGLALARLADDSIVVCGLQPGGPAERAGIQWGATMLAWGGQPIAKALAETSLFWADAPAATPTGRLQQQLLWLPRGRNGETFEVTFKNPEAADKSTVTLGLEFDDFASLALARPLWKPVDLFDSPIQARALPGDIHYIRIAAMAPTFSTPFPTRDFRTAVKAAIDKNAKGLILDLRGTQGGDASLTPKFLSSFVSEATFFETPSVWDSELEAFLVESEETIDVEPQLPPYVGPMVVLVDGYTLGPAESLANFLEARKNVRLCGTSPTAGSPGTPGLEITLPGGYVVFVPNRRSLDARGKIQCTANAKGEGAVAPKELVALDTAQATALYLQREDIVLKRAQTLLGTAH